MSAQRKTTHPNNVEGSKIVPQVDECARPNHSGTTIISRLQHAPYNNSWGITACMRPPLGYDQRPPPIPLPTYIANGYSYYPRAQTIVAGHPPGSIATRPQWNSTRTDQMAIKLFPSDRENAELQKPLAKAVTSRPVLMVSKSCQPVNKTSTPPTGGSAHLIPPIDEFKRRFHLEMKINNLPVTMTIDSGCHISMIGQLVWQQLGKPILEPVSKSDSWASATGTKIVILGKFNGKVDYAGKIFQLPVFVNEQPDITNLLGRAWFPALHLDWNLIFNCNGLSQYQQESDKQRQLVLKMASGLPTHHYFIDVKIEGIKIKMMLDTGASVSVISEQTWEELGKPLLQPNRLHIVDAAKKVVPAKGICMVKVEYNGREGMLPLIVTTAKCSSILGTNGFKTLQFNFNSLFLNVNFYKPKQPSISTAISPRMPI